MKRKWLVNIVFRIYYTAFELAALIGYAVCLALSPQPVRINDASKKALG